MRRRIGLAAGPLLLVAVLASPTGLEPAAHRLAAVFGLVLVWWVTEAVPLAVTAVLGPTLAVVLGVAGAGEAYASFGHPVIFLFLGSFLIARAMEIHGLDRRIALGVLALPWVGESPARIMLAFGAIGFLLSMWISNTATTAMMLPIAAGVLSTLDRGPATRGKGARFGTGLMLMVAYSCNVGGIATPVGTPPNLIALGMLEEMAGIRISFVQWMIVALPVALACFGVVYLLVRMIFCRGASRMEGAREVILRERARLGGWSAGERGACGAFLAAVSLWLLPGMMTIAPGVSPSFARWVSDSLPEAASAVLAAATLFVLPSGRERGKGALTWREAAGIDWGTILLFGGGLSLGKLAFTSGLSEALGHFLEAASSGLGPAGLILVAILTADVLTEFMSNTATANLLIPLFLAAAVQGTGGAALPAVAAAMGCSIAFSLPVATPPNAIVYSSGRVPLGAMLRTGVTLDLLCALTAWICLLAWQGNLGAPAGI